MSKEQKICDHCGERLPFDYPYIYCAEGLEEFRDRQAVLDKDPLVTNLVYGNFTDPVSGRNHIAVQYRRGMKGIEQRRMITAVKHFLKPMFDSKKPRDQYFNFDPEPTPYIGIDRLWNDLRITRLRWDGIRLRKMLRRVE